MPRGPKERPIESYWMSYDSGFRTLCWAWQGSASKLGYGKVVRDGRLQPAHRYMYERHIGAIPAGHVIDHLCRVPSCVNPWHLEPVTQRENVHRGRSTKLTTEQVAAIRADERSAKDAAPEFGVTATQIRAIRRGAAWKAA